MRITDRLRAQNDVVLQQLEHLERLINGGAAADVLAAVVETIAAAEEEHSVNEEPILISALGRVLGPGYPALREISEDHRHLRRLRSQMASGDCDVLQARVFVEVLRAHLQREARDLFPLVDRWVERAALSESFDERVDVGARD
jgi:hemerythrin-like domain-containing protein